MLHSRACIRKACHCASSARRAESAPSSLGVLLSAAPAALAVISCIQELQWVGAVVGPSPAPLDSPRWVAVCQLILSQSMVCFSFSALGLTPLPHLGALDAFQYLRITKHLGLYPLL